MKATTLDEYLERYGPTLAETAAQRFDPLHRPTSDSPALPPLLRQPFPAQAHAIAGLVASLKRDKSVFLCAEMGTGKTLQSIAATHALANGRPYRALVVCPGHIVEKWCREITETIPGADAAILDDGRAIAGLADLKGTKPTGPWWRVISRNRAKLGAEIQPAFTTSLRSANVFCPTCGATITDAKDRPVAADELAEDKGRCRSCGDALWSEIGPQRGGLNRFCPSRFISRKLRGLFDTLILDEAHELKGKDTAQGLAAAKLASACSKVIALTGTLIGGYADHIRPLLFRLAPASLVREGLSWHDATEFNRRYGRIETVTKSTEVIGRGLPKKKPTTRTTERIRPGIVPGLFGRHLLGQCVYMTLDQVASELPGYTETIIPVTMDADVTNEYNRVRTLLRNTNAQLSAKGNQQLLGAMLNFLLVYPDMPRGWGELGYYDGGQFTAVAEPNDFPERIDAKEQAVIDLCHKEKSEGRQVWVYCLNNGERNVQGLLAELLRSSGLKAVELRGNISPEKREAWIAKHAPSADVILSHPMLVETGIDLFDKRGSYNFPTMIWYSTGYNPFTLRQASRRAWRIGQTRDCRVFFLYWKGSMQQAAMNLMSQKMAASNAIEGKFSSAGLAALAGDDDSCHAALMRAIKTNG